MAVEIALLATDLDGTLIGSANEFPLYAEFRDRLERLQHVYGTIWVACTGRTFRSFVDFFRPMRRMGILPDYVIVRHAFLFTRTRFGFLPHLTWNVSTMIHLWQESRLARDAIVRWHQSITGGALGVITVRKSARRLCLRFDSEESASAAADILKADAETFPHLMVFLSGRDVDVRCVPATKGMAVAELARYLDIAAEDILAVGNGHNDISMLTPRVAALTGCPSNSDLEVMLTVHEQGGHVAKQRSLAGVMEVIDAYEEGVVCGDLPEGFDITGVTRSSPHKMRRKGGATGRLRRPKSHPLLFAGIAYAGLLAFAQFDVLPYSHIIRKPLELLVDAAARLLNFF